MSMNMDAAIRIKANVQGANAIQAFSRDLKGLDGVAKLSGAELGRMNIAINRMAREAGNTTAGLRQHIAALSNLRERVEIGGKAYNRLGGEIDQLRGKLRALDKDAEKTGSTLKDKLVSGLATVGVGRLTGGIIGKAANFDQEVRKAAAIEGTGSYDALRKSIEGVASVAAGTPTQVAQLATALSRAGFTAKETAQALEGIVMGAEASAVSFEEMGSIAADSMRAFGIDTSKTQQVVDILVKSANSSNQTVLDLGESLKYAAPIARSLGVNINDLAATMAILANNGIRGSEAGTALRTGLQRLQIAASGNNEELLGLTRGSALLGKAMKVLGADVLDARGQIKPLDEALISMKRNLARMPVGVQAEVVKALFGDEAGGKLRAALNSTEADIRKMFATIRNSGGAAAETRKEMQGFQNALDRLGGNIETVTNAIGDKFALVLGPLVEGLNITIGALNQMPQPLKDIAAAMAAAGIATLGWVLAMKTLGGIAALTGITTGLTGAITAFTSSAAFAAITTGGLSGALGVLKLAIFAIPGWGWAAAGVTALGLLGKAVYDNNETFRAWVQNIGGVVANDFKAAMRGMADDAKVAATNAAGHWQSFTTFLGQLGGWIKEMFSGVFGSTAQSSQQAAKQSENGWANAWNGMLKNASEAFTGLGQMIANWWNKLPAPIRGWMAGQAQSTGIGMQLRAADYIMDASSRAVAKGTNGVNRDGKGDLPNIIPALPVMSGSMDFGGGGPDGGAAKAKKAADEAKRALDQYNAAVKSGSDATRTLMERLQDVNLSLIGIGTNATDALGVQRLKAEMTAAREYGEEMRKIGELEKQRNEAAAKGISTKDLDARIQAAKDLAAQLREVRSQEAYESYSQSLADLLPKEADFNRQLKEAALLAENKKRGIEGLTEVQKLNLQIELLDLEAKAEGNEVLKERIRLLREKAGALDALNEKQEKTFGESIKDKLQAYYNSIKDIGGAIGDVMVKAFQGIEDKLTEFVTTGKANFKELARSILEDLARIAIRAAIIKPLVGAIGGLFEGFTFAKGGIMTGDGPVPLKTYARGGIAKSPQLALYGEGSQPEAYVPLPDGRRIPVALKGGGGGGNSVVNVNVDASGNSQVSGNAGQGEALGRVIAQAVQAEMIRQKRPGGLLAA
jgi:TP901 family phage tail tape measure protein/lambda family phage tail tape measure protein